MSFAQACPLALAAVVWSQASQKPFNLRTVLGPIATSSRGLSPQKSFKSSIGRAAVMA